MGSTSDHTANFFNMESWFDLTVLNQINIVEQRYGLAIIEANGGKRKEIDFII
jgi:hypothetical protein